MTQRMKQRNYEKQIREKLQKYKQIVVTHLQTAAERVAYQLFKIFMLFGVPQIVQSNNGSEFTAHLIDKLKLLWTDNLMVHGKPRHPQSQGSVERLNCDIKGILIAWLGDNHSKDWPNGLCLVKLELNQELDYVQIHFPW